MNDKDNTKKITQLQMQFEFDKEKELIAIEQQKNEIAANEELKRQKLFRNSSIVVLIMVLVVLFLVLKNY